MPTDKERLVALARRINETSNADFVKRLLNEKRKTLKNDDGTVSTHELGYVTEDGGAVIFPNVQSVGDSLARFHYPEYYKRAVGMGDTVRVGVPDAELFTQKYKEIYPGFSQYTDGGLIHRFDEGGDKYGLWYNPDFDLGVYGGMIEPAVIASSPTSASAKYNIVKKQYKDARKEQKAIAKEIGSGTWYGPFYDYVNTRKKHFRSAQQMKPIWDRIEALPNIELLGARYEMAKDNYYGQIGGVNSIPAQLYRFYSRRLGYQKHQSRRNNRPVITGDGADIIDLSNNVIRLSPNSEQSTALFNEFVERKYPTVRKAADYKENQDLILGDAKKFPAKDVSIYGGIEGGKFKLDSLRNFNDTTTIIPARNIRRGTQRISKINIQTEANDEYSDVDKIKWRLGYRLHEASAFNPFYALMDNYNDERIISAAKNLREDFRKKYGLYDENGEFNIKNRSSNLKKIDNAFGKILSGEKISYDEAGSLLSFFRNSGDQYIERMLAGNAAPGMDYQKYWPSSKNSESKYYSFVGEDGTEYPISLYNAAILDGKTLLANPDGGVFVGRIQDISPAQLDSLNTYLESNPSWLMRPDLGSFDQYRLDNPSLETYLKQFFEHPKANDPNVYTVGTVTPNKLWEKRYGGLLKKYDGGGSIHIKPSHRGRLTELKERTGKTESELYNDGNPAHKKMVVFARNSRRWSHNHAGGGYLQDYRRDYELGGVYDLTEGQVQELIQQGYEVEQV